MGNLCECRSPQKRLFVSSEQDLEDSPCSNAAAARMMEDDTLDDDVQVKMTRQNTYFALITGKGGESNRVADPDWIWIQSGQWIRILIRNPDPDPGGQK